MDIVYVLGKGSLCNDEELRFSLRSMEMYCEDLGKVFVVGECPEWLTDVEHIPYESVHKKPWKNTLDMVKLACLSPLLSKDFLLMNDDFFAFAPFSICELPFYAVKGGNGGASGPVDFAIHRPIRLNKEFYLKLPITSDMSTSYSPRTFYGNFMKCPPTYAKDLVFRTGEGMPALEDQLADHCWGTIDDVTMTTAEFQDFIVSQFPAQCRFEKEDSCIIKFGEEVD